ncbi:uncharacterized protein LOC134689678 [Mytilus trossulus]|uniref:uncharacterized protein LOC134689678 n=1 Tax=Mytilus trossulus TaxID=6551 RepID=UPI003007661A
MDLSKAFDCLPHDLLLLKLEAYGLSTSSLKLIKNYLSNRKQCVRVGSSLSNWQNIYKGVPQGSILGPILFNIFINDIFHFTTNSSLYNYADDNTLSYANRDIDTVISTLEKDSLALIEWFSSNQMKANPEKFQALAIGKKTMGKNITFDLAEAIDDLLIRGLIIECTNDKPLVVNPLTVSVQNNGKKRLILDLRHVNLHLWKTSVKFEDIRVAMQFIKQDFYCFKFDIHSAYHHLDIYEPHTDYLGFSWTYGESTKYFKFLVLPFGLSSACYIFTKVTRPLIKKWRGEGKQILMYLDDGFGTHSDINSCTDIAAQVKQDLIDSGFVPKVEKFMWSPSKTLIYLGYFIDTDKAILSIPVERLSKLFDTIIQVEQSLGNLGRVYVRTIASVIGQIISMSYVIGNVAYILTKYLSIDVMSACSWKSYIELSAQSKEQLIFWKKNIKCVNFKHFVSDFSCHTIVYSDASGTGYGGYTVENPKNIAHGMWHETDVHRSSTWRELTAVECVLHSLIDFMSDKRIKWFTGNQNVVSIVHKDSMKPDLQDIAYDIFVTCLKYNVSLEVEWIPRAQNEIADYISRIIDTDDWAKLGFGSEYVLI